MTSAFSGKNNFSTKSIVRRNMSKSAQQNKQQRKEIREQFLKELYNKEESEHGISIFDEKVYKPKRFRTEIKVPMERIRPTQVSAAKVQVKAVKPRKPKTLKSSVNITLRRPTQPKPAPMERKAEVPLGPRPPPEHWNKATPKPRPTVQKQRPVPLPRTKKPIEKPVPPPRIRKPVKQPKEKELQPPVITPEEHEVDPFGTDLQKPLYRKVETAVDGAAVTYMISPTYLDPQNQLTASRQVVREILEKEEWEE
jgi:hypothetical protein